jgi:hypothetical protein
MIPLSVPVDCQVHRRRLYLPAALAALLCLCSSARAQVQIVTDRANTGQLKRMVFERWDDWQPDPGTNWLGLPRDPEGFLYWRILHGPYHRGEDRRPFAPTGPFPSEYAALLVQEQADRTIRDSTEAVARDALSTHLQRSGGDLDMPWRLYFGARFGALEQEMDRALQQLALRHPARMPAWMDSRSFRSLSETRDILTDRIRQVHEGYLDLGRRMEAYLPLLTEWERLRDRYLAWTTQQALLATLPTPVQQDSLRRQLLSARPPNDKAIVQDILRRF